MDGVLVENVEFELAVTEYIVGELAAGRRIAHSGAAALWREELLSTKGDPRWYDYDFHSERLGVRPIALEAHRLLKPLLSLVEGADETLCFLRDNNIETAIVSDAMSWVVRFKMEALNLSVPDLVLTSESAGAPKKDSAFWIDYKDRFGSGASVLYVDNRYDNLAVADSVLGGHVALGWFAREEHVMTIAGFLDGRDGDIGATEILDHRSLIAWMSSHLDLPASS